ncbi:MAG: FAD-dependent oxidoreductase [Rhodoferax sp.]|nr:FAD-dependent oxidoreductase [Rhodoferax sp.]
MTAVDSIVIVGGGHAGAQMCAALAGAGLGPQVHLVCEEPCLPYQRPPLSKSFLKDAQEPVQEHRGSDWYQKAGITVHVGDAVTAIDRDRRSVTLRSGSALAYSRLVLATGARARTLPQLSGPLDNVAVLRSAEDALRLRAQLQAAQAVSVLGGGFIGLEIAATAGLLGKRVSVFESAPRLLARSVSPELAEHVLQAHRSAGLDVRLGVSVDGYEVQGERLAAMRVDGERVPVDLLVVGIGAVSEKTLAQEAGLTCGNGIVVDACMRTSDASILAIGDCTEFPEAGSGHMRRLESVQNANDQAKTALATILGREEPYRALPWFWSEQGGVRLQMAGLMPADGTRHRREGSTPNSFSILHYVGSSLRCVESVNLPIDHLMARKLLEAGRSPPWEQACDPAVALKSFLA